MGEERQKQSGSFGCREFDANLAAYLDGDGSADASRHLEQCSSCRSLVEDLALIQSAAKDWPLESPSPRVWSNIRATLAEEGYFRKQESLWKRWNASIWYVPSKAPAAALAFALMLAVIMVFKGDIQRNGSQNRVQAPATASVAPVGLTGVQSNLVHTVQAMEENYKARESSLDPSAKQIYQAGLTSLDNSIQECLDSLQKQPHNMLVREYLMQAYAQKVEVLTSALEYGGR
jgi:hypothetical protein